MGERVLVLGAGASLGARAGLGVRTNDEPLPPLGRGLARYLLRWLRANDLSRKLRPVMVEYRHWSVPSRCPHFSGRRIWESKELGAVRLALREVAERERESGSSVPFEGLMDAWSTSGRDQRRIELAQTLLSYSMTVGFGCAFAESCDRLDDLVAMVRPTIVVTVNYDTLTEEALLRAGLRITYPRLPGPRASGAEEGDYVSSYGPGDLVPVFKLHGSINWLPISGVAVGADLATVERVSAERPTSILKSGPLVASQTWATYVPPNRGSLLFELERALSGTGSPVAAVYGTGKNLLKNPRHVERHRAACLARLRAASIDCAVVVGLRLVSRTDDPVVADVMDLLAERAHNKLYASPDAGVYSDSERRGFTPVPSTLEQLIAR